MQPKEIKWPKHLPFFYLILFFTFLFDRLTKWLAVNFWQEGFFVWPDFWQVKLYQNNNLPFNLPVSYPLNLILIIPIFLIVIYFLVHSWQRKQTGLIMAFSLVTFGAFSNLLDRFRYGFVIDFINLDFGLFANPAFNLADLLICAGLVLLIILLFSQKKEPI